MIHNDQTTIVLSSVLASISGTLISNPLEVLKIRQQTSQFHCSVHPTATSYLYKYMGYNQPHNHVKYVHTVALTGQAPKPQFSLLDQWYQMYQQWSRMFQNTSRVLKPKSSKKFLKIHMSPLDCSCISTDSLYKTVYNIYHNEGPKTFFNGWRYAVMQATTSNVIYFLFYEQIKQWLKKQEFKKERYIVPFIASSISRTLTTTLTFPLEYWRVLQQSSEGYTVKKNWQLGGAITSAYFVTIQRDVLFSCLYWSILENTKQELHNYPIQQDAVNFMSGVIAGVTTALITLPLDVVKTRKQVSTRRDNVNSEHSKELNQSTYKILKNIFNEEGVNGLFKGYKPRMAKVTLHAGTIYMMYEHLKLKFRHSANSQ